MKYGERKGRKGGMSKGAGGKGWMGATDRPEKSMASGEERKRKNEKSCGEGREMGMGMGMGESYKGGTGEFGWSFGWTILFPKSLLHFFFSLRDSAFISSPSPSRPFLRFASKFC